MPKSFTAQPAVTVSRTSGPREIGGAHDPPLAPPRGAVRDARGGSIRAWPVGTRRPDRREPSGIHGAPLGLRASPHASRETGVGMDRCMGCGGQLTTGGCCNPDCAMALGGMYLNGKKVATASGRSLIGTIDVPSIMWAGGLDDGALAERARIVAWLRSKAYGISLAYAGALADAIERGDHLRPTKDGGSDDR